MERDYRWASSWPDGTRPSRYCVPSVQLQGQGSFEWTYERGMVWTHHSPFWTREYQKRGLPHIHLLLILNSDKKIETADDINRLVSALLPKKLKMKSFGPRWPNVFGIYHAVRRFPTHHTWKTVIAQSRTLAYSQKKVIKGRQIPGISPSWQRAHIPALTRRVYLR